MVDPHDEVIPILDFGSQTTQLIARRVRDAGVFSVLVSPSISVEELRAMRPIGIILSGGPSSVYDKGAPTCDKRIFDLGVPVLGICYGMQLAAHLMGGRVDKAEHREFGRASLAIDDHRDLLLGVADKTIAWMSHGDQVQSLGPEFEVLASTPTCVNAAVRSLAGGRRFFGVQFHPEVTHTPFGTDLIRNFVYEICKARGAWRMADFAEDATNRLREKIDRKSTRLNSSH